MKPNGYSVENIIVNRKNDIRMHLLSALTAARKNKVVRSVHLEIFSLARAYGWETVDEEGCNDFH